MVQGVDLEPDDGWLVRKDEDTNANSHVASQWWWEKGEGLAEGEVEASDEGGVVERNRVTDQGSGSSNPIQRRTIGFIRRSIRQLITCLPPRNGLDE